MQFFLLKTSDDSAVIEQCKRHTEAMGMHRFAKA